jgi:hypothetical protein
MNCQRKVLILEGMHVFQTSLKQITVAPCDKHMYIELVEYNPEGSRDHETASASSSTGSP